MILQGKDFDRGLTAYKVVEEVLNRRFLIQFEKWCTANDEDIPFHLKDGIIKFAETITNRNAADEETITKLLGEVNEVLDPLLTNFRRYGREKSPTFRFWDDFLTRVMLPLKMFLSSSRSGNWEINQYAKLKLLPLLYASNRSTYAKYLTVQLLKMNRLPDDIQTGFEKGDFVAKLSKGKFNSVWIDYVLEATENKALKGIGGIIGLTLRRNALLRWFLSRPLTSKYSMVFHESITKTSSKIDDTKIHHSDTKAKIKQYNDSCKEMSEVFNNTFIDPFDTSSHCDCLVNIATGVEAAKDVQEHLLNYLNDGSTALETFVQERLIVSPEERKLKKSFYDPMPRTKLKTMSDMNKKVTVRSKEVIISGDVMFQRLLAVNSYKKISPERVFSFENTPVPLSMYAETGEMLTGKKSDFMAKLETLQDNHITSLGSADCIVFDGMAVIQMLGAPALQPTFYDMAKIFLEHILLKSRCITGVKQIHIIFDKYNSNSIKSSTRKKRGDIHISNNVYVQGHLRVPKDLKSFLLIGQNKETLARYFTEYMHQNARDILTNDEVLIVSGGQGDNATEVTVDNKPCHRCFGMLP